MVDVRGKSLGFTLIEVMIVVAIIGLLAAIALPSYLEQVRKSHRTDAQTAMLELAQRLERCFTMENAYDASPCPSSQDTVRYEITAAVPTPTSFIITAVPQGVQAADSCGDLEINHLGTRKPANCWN